MITLHPQYIKDANGNKSLVILPVEELDTILEELDEIEDIKLYDESKKDNEPAFTKSEAMVMMEAERKKMGK